MRVFAAVVTLQKIPVWRDFIFADSPPDLEVLNSTLTLGGDCLFAQEITNQETIDRLCLDVLSKAKALQENSGNSV